MNSQKTFHRRPALAGLLLVLTASTVLAQNQKNNFSVLGSFSGHDIGVVQGGTLQATESGVGTASHIGRFNFALNATVDLATAHATGVFLMVLSNGDVIYGSFSGQGNMISPNLGHIVEHMTINGGTGRFQGATGDFTLDRLQDQSTLPAFDSTSGTLTGTISTPPSDK
jgi:hypothetical protein